jgi:hypothetical protein
MRIREPGFELPPFMQEILMGIAVACVMMGLYFLVQ